MSLNVIEKYTSKSQSNEVSNRAVDMLKTLFIMIFILAAYTTNMIDDWGFVVLILVPGVNNTQSLIADYLHSVCRLTDT